MKRSLWLILKVAALVALSIGGGFAFASGYYFTFALVVAALAALGVSIYVQQRRLERKVQHMISRIRYGDLNVSFPADAQGADGELYGSMNEALSQFRSRLYENIVSHAEMDAWQKLIRVLAHEIMNSLAPIISLSETMSERGARSEASPKEYALMLEAMQSIHRRSEGLLHFVENYRRLTRIPEPMKQFFAVGELLEGMRGVVDSAVRIECDVKPADLRLYADRAQIEQVVLNLISNAAEASKNGVNIRISARTEDGKTLICVADDGPGILPECMDKIFVPFYSTKQTGLGIGLSIARQIMGRHGGSIAVASAPGEGAAFTLMFG